MEPGVSLTSDFISLQSMFEIQVPRTWSALSSFLAYSSQNCLFQKVLCPKEHLHLLFHTPHGIHSFFGSPQHAPPPKSLCKSLQAPSVSQQMIQLSCDLYQAIPYAASSTVSDLLLLIAHDYTRILSKISGDTSTGIYL